MFGCLQKRARWRRHACGSQRLLWRVHRYNWFFWPNQTRDPVLLSKHRKRLTQLWRQWCFGINIDVQTGSGFGHCQRNLSLAGRSNHHQFFQNWKRIHDPWRQKLTIRRCNQIMGALGMKSQHRPTFGPLASNLSAAARLRWRCQHITECRLDPLRRQRALHDTQLPCSHKVIVGVLHCTATTGFEMTTRRSNTVRGRRDNPYSAILSNFDLFTRQHAGQQCAPIINFT